MILESLGGIGTQTPDPDRCIALELERIAMHIGDTAALCGDIAYQFGQVVNEALRTIVINTTQLWCGNRFGRGLIRPGGTNYPLTGDLKKIIVKNLEEVEERYRQITSNMFTMSSVLSRFETTGTVTKKQALLIGAVGMAARSSGLERDIRSSHPFLSFQQHPYKPVILDSGDVWARAMLRNLEVEKSVAFIKQLLNAVPEAAEPPPPVQKIKLQPGMFSLAMTEGWRGEIVHAAVTDDSGKLVHYKVKDPSFHNWMALALAVRNQEISDFPLCNKSYNLSYCGNDL
jgi:Ni,Fe-hydrogenase III large subunit